MIERIDRANTLSLDFIQDEVNKHFTDKINEIIDYINKKESEE